MSVTTPLSLRQLASLLLQLLVRSMVPVEAEDWPKVVLSWLWLPKQWYSLPYAAEVQPEPLQWKSKFCSQEPPAALTAVT
jgi:hypothetical protein